MSEKQKDEITIVAGPCAVESEEQTMDMGEKISTILHIAASYNIRGMFRGGAYKPRTNFVVQNGSRSEKVFEGTGEDGVKWLAQVAGQFGIPVVSEVMSEMDIRHFARYLEADRDFLQIGARTSQAFALLYEVGGYGFSVVLKNPQHGVDPAEAVGSLERFQKNKELAYCIRGQKRPIDPSGENSAEHLAYLTSLHASPHQYRDARNLNNIASIGKLRSMPSLDNVSLWYDPSHIFGGKTDEMRRTIGDYAKKAITEFGYDGIIVEVNDRSATAKCDADQAMFSTLRGIDWSQTKVGLDPEQKPLSLVDVVKEIMFYQVQRGATTMLHGALEADYKTLDSLRWDLPLERLVH